MRVVAPAAALGHGRELPAGARGAVILLDVREPVLRRAIVRSARPDEAVIWEACWVQEALERGHPRVYIRDDRAGRGPLSRTMRVPELHVSAEMLAAWEQDRRRSEIPTPRVDDLARRMGAAIHEVAVESTWVDRLLADLARAAGAPLPLSLRAFTRHTLELPCRYTDLSAISSAAGLSRGALKARFRRKGLASPFTYLRWLRIFAVAELLADPDVTVAVAARSLGFTSDTNMCRMVKALSGATPGSLRNQGARRRLQATFVQRHLGEKALDHWARLDDLFAAAKVA